MAIVETTFICSMSCEYCVFGKVEVSLREIFGMDAVKRIIAHESTLWEFCKGCMIGCSYEVSAIRNGPHLALKSAMDFLRVS